MNFKKVLLLGSGALKIGEAGEFDYSGTQAIKALKEENVEIVLVNPNVATVQTSKGLADQIYFLPVTPYFVEKIIQKEKPDGILLSFGGQTALNCGIELHNSGVLRKFGVKILGIPIQAVIDTEDREKFCKRLESIGLKTARGEVVATVPDGIKIAGKLGFPVMLRAGFALGGMGSGIARDKKSLEKLLTNIFAVSPQAIVEENLTGWKEIEYEVVRDKENNCIAVCNMENMDPVGIHTGESIVVAPSQTLNNEEYYRLRQVAIDVVRELKIVGECNIQFAINPTKFDYRIIEVNARLSRSSALASKATGYPLAYIAAKLALGYTLPDLRNLVTGVTTAFFEPALDYIVVKIPRWDLDKLMTTDIYIGSEMKSVGEVMAIGRTFPEAIQKAARMLNDGYNGVVDVHFTEGKKREFLQRLKYADSMRLFTICSALIVGISISQINKLTGIDSWFLNELQQIVHLFKQMKHDHKLSKEILTQAKKAGFSDRQIADIYKTTENKIRNKRMVWKITPNNKRIDTMAGEFPAKTNYLYLTYNASESDHIPLDVIPAKEGIYLNRFQVMPGMTNKQKKVAVLGSGPYAIGSSVEFDWCAVQTVLTLRNRGIKAICINCNPETVSTDFDYADYLYFEELTLER
ncbi:MAG: carbamoyl-phosphate synthase large subunit, partial [Patescibacteria group bacterium]